MVDFKALAAPFPPDRVSWRVGAMTQDKKRGLALAYCDARDVMDRLDAVCGPHGWQCSYPPRAGSTTICRIEIKIGDEWVGKEDGAGDTDVEKEKGALSDAFKRAAVRWGVGRYLYDVSSPWVALDDRKGIADGELPKLRALLSKGAPAATKDAKAEDPFSPPPPPATKAASNGASWAVKVPMAPDGLGADWEAWTKLMEDKIGRAPTQVALDKLWADNAPAMKNCPEPKRGELFDQYQARRQYHQRSAAA